MFRLVLKNHVSTESRQVVKKPVSICGIEINRLRNNLSYELAKAYKCNYLETWADKGMVCRVF